ncbi:MAG: LacI family DNA-binding transcriptional regulator [Jiangellaceae bacterium]
MSVVRLRDVAARAGVSIKTVSNVVNGYPHVSARTRARVEQTVAELNYRPNIAARNLRQARSGVIALAVPEVDMPYFAELARSVIKAAAAHGWTVLIDQTDGRRDNEQMVLAGIRDHLIDGLIFSPLALGPELLAERTDSTPLVLLGERVEAGPADHVAIDNVAAARAVTQHLLALGRLRIAAIGDQRQASGETARLRLTGYRLALEAAGVPYDPRLVVPARTYHRADGARAMRRLLAIDQPPDAVFCFNDLLALGALRTLHEHGKRVPQDVAVAGVDDIEDGRFSVPSLTTVSPDKEAIAEHAVSMLAARLAGDDAVEPRDVRAPFTLQVRESTVGRRWLPVGRD